MKDNLNIEELFKEKFSSFEGEVRPDAWTNIQQGMNAAGASGAAAAKTGMSVLMKTVIVSGGIIAATVAGVYLFSNDEETNTTTDNIVSVDHQSESTNNQSNEDQNIIQVMDENDPVIEENREELEREIQENAANPDLNYGNDNAHNDSSTNRSETYGNEDQNATVVDNNNGSGEENSGDEASNNESEAGNNGSDQADNNNDSGDNGAEPQEQAVARPAGELTFEAGDDFAPSTYTFHANPEDYQTVTWDFGDGTIGDGADVEHTYEKPGDYTVLMKVIGNGEVYEESQVITIQTRSKIAPIPNIITPNGDRINDFFTINTTEIETFFIAIRDSKGIVVFESNDLDFRWDGTDLGGNPLDKGRCTYMIFATGFDGSEFEISGQIYIE